MGAGLVISTNFPITDVVVHEYPTPTAAGFSDVHEGDYYADAVDWTKENGIISGTPAATFSPNNAVTRAEAVTFLWCAAGSAQTTSGVSLFSDVTDTGACYCDALLRATENSLIDGLDFTQKDSCFRVDVVYCL